ncbi:serine hydrolase domain-containing protein [Cesiribacter andamanensis]|uniref:Putative periplasmic esterase n=1 Tax=Cesiribacter andamanensis AMV16 TaxID=1279009 RepID=M7NSY1_9BACT|nr:serine hydrolase [Cesiribacter andamanensis]EMR01599.1 putative periplasmic esterase [Cesiribacter andamanensis AMV16]
MRYTPLLLGSLVVLLLTATGWAQAPHAFAYASPESKGFSSAQLDSLSAFLSRAGSSALLVMVDGAIIYEWGETGRRHTIHSIRKAMINALYGIKVADGSIDTSMTLRQLALDDIAPSLTEQEKGARIADLLKSRSGVYHPAAAVSEGMLRNMPARDTHAPGTHYYYNNWDFNVLGAILEQQTGQTIYQLFYQEIALPLGMYDYAGTVATLDGDSEGAHIPDTDGYYQYERSKSRYPAYHFRLSARDMALFGQLYLNEGSWEGRQLIPASWIRASTKPYSVTNPGYGIGYGMLWDVLMKTENRASSSFYHTGLGIHMLGVYPAEKLVLVHRVNTEREHHFTEGEFYRMIRLVFAAKSD